MKIPPSVLYRIGAIKNDPALQPEKRGDRKQLVTELYKTEKNANSRVWKPPTKDNLCEVILTDDTEAAVFTNIAKQDRHYHNSATEIYILLEGKMIIEIENEDYVLDPLDMIVVMPGAKHKVKSNSDYFLCRLVSVNCKGTSDRVVVE